MSNQVGDYVVRLHRVVVACDIPPCKPEDVLIEQWNVSRDVDIREQDNGLFVNAITVYAAGELVARINHAIDSDITRGNNKGAGS